MISDECADSLHEKCWGHWWCDCSCHEDEEPEHWEAPPARPITNLDTKGRT